MGIQKSIIEFTGKIGNVRGSTWKGRKVIAQQPAGYNDANTAVQQANRRKFALAVERGREFLPAIKVGFKKAAIGKTESNVFTQLNLPSATDNGTVAALPYSAIKVAMGNVKGFSALAGTPTGVAGQFKFAWDDNSDGGSGLSTDLVCTCDVCGTSWVLDFTMTNVTRADGEITISRGADHAGHDFHTYLFFKRAGASDVSDSEYTLVEAGA